MTKIIHLLALCVIIGWVGAYVLLSSYFSLPLADTINQTALPIENSSKTKIFPDVQLQSAASVQSTIGIE